ncbi:MAG TPA: hypothetical protein VHV26_13170, partial [Rhizomicrobium sp.]|nr:hypothetical protein [Rhizomicrobium sp.]
MHIDLRQEGVEYRSGIAYQRAFHRGAQADALGIVVDLNNPRLTGLGIEFDIGETAAYDQQGVTFRQGFLRRSCAQQADATRGMGMIVGQC